MHAFFSIFFSFAILAFCQCLSLTPGLKDNYGITLCRYLPSLVLTPDFTFYKVIIAFDIFVSYSTFPPRGITGKDGMSNLKAKFAQPSIISNPIRHQLAWLSSSYWA